MPAPSDPYAGTLRDGREMAVITSQYYGALVANGVTHQAAVDLTRMYLTLLFNASVQK